MSLLEDQNFLRSKPEHGGGSSTLSPAPPRVLDVHELLAGGREVVIIHKGESYRLRITAKDRLILTK